MARELDSYYILNRGEIDRRALAHVNSRRLALGVEEQTNWLSRVQGHMSLRPGLGFIGEIAGNPNAGRGSGAAGITLAPNGVGANGACAGTGAVNRIQAADFTALTGTVTFEEVALLTNNPVITAAMYGGGTGAPDVSAGPYFDGQSYQTIFDPDGPGYLMGTITSPLALDTSPDAAVTVSDGAWTAHGSGNTTTLAGNADFTLGIPFVILFSTDVVGVAFTLGGFNTLGSVRVRAYSRTAALLGTWTNNEGVPSPFETFYLNRDSDTPIIAGISIEISPTEDQGVVMKNVQFSMTCADP